jgi:hypothetical protein
MKCPLCTKDNKTSRCFSSNNVRSTAGSGFQYWDEVGVYHNHDPNTAVSSYRCSRGHFWTVKSRHPCAACNFGHIEPEIQIISPSA